MLMSFVRELIWLSTAVVLVNVEFLKLLKPEASTDEIPPSQCELFAKASLNFKSSDIGVPVFSHTAVSLQQKLFNSPS